MNDENRRTTACDVVARRRVINDVTQGPSSNNTNRRLPRDPLTRCHQRDGSATRLPSRVETVVRNADGFDVVRRTSTFHRSESVNDVEKTFHDGRRINTDRRRNITDLPSPAARQAELQRRQFQQYYYQDRPWNSLDLPQEPDPATSRHRRPLSASPIDVNREDCDSGDSVSRLARRSTRPPIYRVNSGMNFARQGFEGELCIGSRTGEHGRARAPVRTASFDVESSHRSTDAGSWHAAADDWYGSRSPGFAQTQLPRSRSDTRKFPSPLQHCSPIAFDSRRDELISSQDRCPAAASIARPIGNLLKTAQRLRGPLASSTPSTLRLQDQPNCFAHCVQPVTIHHPAEMNQEAFDTSNPTLMSEESRDEIRYLSSPTNHQMTSHHMKVNRDDSGYKSIESRQSVSDHQGFRSPSTSPLAQSIVPSTSASSTRSNTNFKDMCTMRSEASSNSDKKAHNFTGEVSSADPSQWMIDWIQWRKGKKDGVDSVKPVGNEDNPMQASVVGKNNTSDAPEKVFEDGAKSPAANESPSKITAGNGNRLAVLKNLTRGLEKTFTGAEQSIGSAISQAAERLLKRRTSSAEETGPSSAAAADMAAEISCTAGYGIPARCADSFSRTSYRTASRRRREFRTRCGRLNNEDGASGIYRDSV